MEAIVTIERLPFYLGPVAPATRSTLPAALPFALGVDPEYGLVRQIVTPDLRQALERAYSGGTMLSTPIGHGRLGAGRFDMVLNALLAKVGPSVAGKSFLEIGCGEGALLAALKARGAQVTGIEIGPQGRAAAERHGIEVIARPLAPRLLKRAFDCIYSYGCLEHIEDLRGFFDACRDHLAPDGTIFHSVPNFASAAATLRKEELAHQHVNYFTAESASAVLRAEGFAVDEIRPTASGNELFMCGRNAGRKPGRAEAVDVRRETALLRSFASRLSESWRAERAFLDGERTGGRIVGLYAGGFVTAVVLGVEQHVRYYDGDELKHGLCWLAGLPPIRDPSSLCDDPVDTLVISPTHHFEAIAAYLREVVGIPGRTTLHCGFAPQSTCHAVPSC